MTTVRAYMYIIHVWNMLRQLSSSHDNGQSMVIYHPCMKHAPSVTFVSWQRMEHDHISLRSESWSVSCHRVMPTIKAWLFINKVWNILRQSSSSLDNGQSMVIYPLGMNHAHSLVIVTWKRSEHGNESFMYESCSISCHRPMTTDRAWLYIPKVWIMLPQLSSSHDNGQIMVIYPSQIWNMHCQLSSSHDNGQSMVIHP